MGLKNFWNSLFNKENKEEIDTQEKIDETEKEDVLEETEEEILEDDSDKAEEEALENVSDKAEEETLEDDSDKTEEETLEDDSDKAEEEILEDDSDKTEEETLEDDSDKTEEETLEDDSDKTEEETLEDDSDKTEEETLEVDSDKTEEETQDEPQPPKKLSFFARLKEGLKKTSNSFSEKFDSLFKGHLEIDDELYDEIEEILITSDISFNTTLKIVDKLKENIKSKKIDDVNLVKPELKEVMYEILSQKDSKLNVDNGQSVIIFVGVNGVGKTTSIGKIAHKLKSSGKSVLLAAGDTFRAAAKEQLEVWSKRADVDIVSHPNEGADPSAVIYDAIQKAKAKSIDVLICDTAGRLHNKKNLMNELEKIKRTVQREHPNANVEILLVIDATTGQNALNQVKTFNEVVNLTGVVLTKLDGTAKGGVILSIMDEYNIPVKFVGVGEKIDDLQEFNARDYVEALF